MNSKMRQMIVLLIAALALVMMALPVGASNPGQEIVYFDKAYNAAESTAAGTAVFTGTVDGAVSGTLKSTLLEVTEKGNGTILLVTFEWAVEDDDMSDGDQSFMAEASGTLNNSTGKVVMNGEVVSGYLAGAKFIEEGQLVDPDTLQFQGSMKLVVNTTD
jgi:hypothetical protein